MKIKLKGICVNISKSRDINKLNKLKEICIKELNDKDNYKGKSKLLEMIISILDKKISIEYDRNYCHEIDTVIC